MREGTEILPVLYQYDRPTDVIGWHPSVGPIPEVKPLSTVSEREVSPVGKQCVRFGSKLLIH